MRQEKGAVAISG